MALERNTARRSVALIVALLVTVSAPHASAGEAPPNAEPAPTRLPASDEAQSDGSAFSRLLIPSIGVNELVRSGVALSVIDQGPAHWVGTESPGGPGNVVLAGHRTTHSAPFRNLDRLEVGDPVLISNADGFIAVYLVRDTFVVTPDDVWITYEQGSPLLTMFACHPKGSARQRIVVQADLLIGAPPP